MKNSVKYLLAVLIFIGVLAVAFFGYRKLSQKAVLPTASVSVQTEPMNVAEKTAVDFRVMQEDGTTVHLFDYFGKPIVINFWATWCGPCKSELPYFEKAYEQYGDEIHFLMVNLTDGHRDTVESVKAFAKENGYRFPILYDVGYEGSDAYGVSSIPLTVLINKDGDVVTSHLGAMGETTLMQLLSLIL